MKTFTLLRHLKGTSKGCRSHAGAKAFGSDALATGHPLGLLLSARAPVEASRKAVTSPRHPGITGSLSTTAGSKTMGRALSVTL